MACLCLHMPWLSDTAAVRLCLQCRQLPLLIYTVCLPCSWCCCVCIRYVAKQQQHVLTRTLQETYDYLVHLRFGTAIWKVSYENMRRFASRYPLISQLPLLWFMFFLIISVLLAPSTPFFPPPYLELAKLLGGRDHNRKHPLSPSPLSRLLPCWLCQNRGERLQWMSSQGTTDLKSQFLHIPL